MKGSRVSVHKVLAADSLVENVFKHFIVIVPFISMETSLIFSYYCHPCHKPVKVDFTKL